MTGFLLPTQTVLNSSLDTQLPMKEQLFQSKLVFAYSLNPSRTLNFILVMRNPLGLSAIKTLDGSTNPTSSPS
jgi:hypothetical protein